MNKTQLAASTLFSFRSTVLVTTECPTADCSPLPKLGKDPNTCYQPGPLSSDEPRKPCIIIKGTVDWESENLSFGPLGISSVPEQKSSHPKPGVKSTSLPPLKASLLQAQVA